jgi:hypothetical protein
MSRSSVALLMPAGGVITALLAEPIEESEFQRACACACPLQPLPVEVLLGEYAIDKCAFTGCSLRLSDASGNQRLTKFRRIERV